MSRIEQFVLKCIVCDDYRLIGYSHIEDSSQFLCWECAQNRYPGEAYPEPNFYLHQMLKTKSDLRTPFPNYGHYTNGNLTVPTNSAISFVSCERPNGYEYVSYGHLDGKIYETYQASTKERILQIHEQRVALNKNLPFKDTMEFVTVRAVGTVYYAECPKCNMIHGDGGCIE